MKTTLIASLMVLGLSGAALAGVSSTHIAHWANLDTGTPTTRPAEAPKYVCPMHPGVYYDHPGKCPKCGMTLVPVKQDKAAITRDVVHKCGMCGDDSAACRNH